MLRRIAVVSSVLLISATGASALEKKAVGCQSLNGIAGSCGEKDGTAMPIIAPRFGDQTAVAGTAPGSSQVADSNIIGRNPPQHRGHFPLPGPIKQPPRVSPN